MPELNDDDLRKIFRTAGHAAPGSDLSARIMARVAVTPMARPVVVEPLIGRRGWIVLAIIAVMLLIATFVIPGTSVPTGPSWFTPMDEVHKHIRLPQDWSLWALLASTTALLFTLVDRSLAHKSVQ